MSGSTSSICARQGILWDGLGAAGMSPMKGSLDRLVSGSWVKAQVPQKVHVWREAWGSHCGWWERRAVVMGQCHRQERLWMAETPGAVHSPGCLFHSQSP